MAVMKDNLKEFVSLRDELLKEKAQLQERLKQIEAVLGSGDVVVAAAPEVPAPRRRGRPPGSGKKKTAQKVAKAKKRVSVKLKLTPPRPKPGKRIRNKVSLREVVMQVTKNNPMTKDEIIKAVLATGYRFNAADPIPSLNSVLYSKKQFKNENGRFSPAK
jgi:hypothetical protein